jgi:hypothetical protein
MKFPLYVPRQGISHFLAKTEIFKLVLGVQRSVVECGLFFAGGLLAWAQISAILEPVNRPRCVIGFAASTC